MADTGFELLMNVVFAGVSKMLTQVLRMVVEELLRALITTSEFQTDSQLLETKHHRVMPLSSGWIIKSSQFSI